MLDAILRDSTHVNTDIHVERFFIFALTFVLKAILTSEEQKRYSDLLKTLVTVLPDDDREISVFDYYVDESCEWDLWTAKSVFNSSNEENDVDLLLTPMFRVDELNENLHDHLDVFGNVLLQTGDLARAQYFLRFASLAKVNVLLSGITGSSKSLLLDSFISSLGSFFRVRVRVTVLFSLQIKRISWPHD